MKNLLLIFLIFSASCQTKQDKIDSLNLKLDSLNDRYDAQTEYYLAARLSYDKKTAYIDSMKLTLQRRDNVIKQIKELK